MPGCSARLLALSLPAPVQRTSRPRGRPGCRCAARQQREPDRLADGAFRSSVSEQRTGSPPRSRPRVIAPRQVGGWFSRCWRRCSAVPRASARERGRERRAADGAGLGARDACACVAAGPSVPSGSVPAGERVLEHVPARVEAVQSARRSGKPSSAACGREPDDLGAATRAPSGSASPRTASTTSRSGTRSGSCTLVETCATPRDAEQHADRAHARQAAAGLAHLGRDRLRDLEVRACPARR